jgi:hypothetical protein
VEAEALVGASRDEVWELLDDLEGLPRWLRRVRAVSASGPAHVGTLYRERTSSLGLPGVRDWEIVEHRRPVRQVRLAYDAGLERALILTLDARGTGTRLHAVVELRSSLPFPLGPAHELLATLPAGWAARGLVQSAKRTFEEAPR